MKRDLFAELQESIRAVGAHRRGQRKLTATHTIPSSAINVRKIQKKIKGGR